MSDDALSSGKMGGVYRSGPFTCDLPGCDDREHHDHTRKGLMRAILELSAENSRLQSAIKDAKESANAHRDAQIAAEAERDILKSRIREFDKSIDAENLDPNGTIWEAANQFLARAESAEQALSIERQAHQERKEITHAWSEEGGGLIVPTGYGFVLYEVPQFGGMPLFSAHCKTLDGAKKIAEGWT